MRLVTDSSADLPKQDREQPGIDLVGIPVFSEDGEALPKGAPLSELYRRMRLGERFLTRSVTTEEYVRFFAPYAERGEEVLYCCTGSALSQNFTHVKAARRQLLSRYPDFSFRILDSNEASLGLGIPVLTALWEIEKGSPKDRVFSRLLYECVHQKLIFAVPDVRRLMPDPADSALLHPHVLNTVPVFEIATAGHLSVIERTRDMESAVERLLQLAGQYGTDLAGKTVGIVHADAAETAAYLSEELSRRYRAERFITCCAGCAVAAHAGPGAVGIVFEY